MGKTRALFKKASGIKGTCHAGVGTTKDKNDKDLIEAKEIEKRWQESTELSNDQTIMMVWSLT